jgi:hypothetical protein
VVIFEIGSPFCPGWPGLQFSYVKRTATAGVTDSHHCIQLFPWKWGLLDFFSPGWLQTVTLPILVCYSMIGMI